MISGNYTSNKNNQNFGNFTTSITKRDLPRNKEARNIVNAFLKTLHTNYHNNDITNVHAAIVGNDLMVTAGPGRELISSIRPSVNFKTEIIAESLNKLNVGRAVRMLERVDQHDANLYQRHQWGA